jgi:cytochrome c-type biogenesis protein CcmH
MDGLAFWAAAGLMAFAVGLYMLRALSQAGSAAPDGANEVSLYQGQLAEIERDLARGVLASAEAERLRTEVQRRILDALRHNEKAAPQGSPAGGLGPKMAALVIMAALAGGAGLYVRYGAPGYADLPFSKRMALADAAYENRPSQDEAEAAAPPAPQMPADAQFLALMDQLRSAVQARPDDLQGLTLLARNEAQMGNFAAARRAYEALIAAKGDAAAADDYLGAAQAMISAAGGLVTPQAEAALMQVLRLDPQNPMARYFSGLMFAQVGRPDRSFDLWAQLLQDSPPDAPWTASLRSLLPQVAAAAGVKYQLPAEFGPSAEDIANAAELSPDDRRLMITGMVEGLENRLMVQKASGTGEEWARLVSSLIVLGEGARAEAAFEAARLALAADPSAMQLVQEAVTRAGMGP